MKVLIVKTSSMGDVLHTLPALTDAFKFNPNIQFDWVIEENFFEIPFWHYAVKDVVPVAIRRWRKNWLSKSVHKERVIFCSQLQQKKYDAIIDAQGLLKSVFLIARLAYGDIHGYDWMSVREPLASIFYDHCYHISKQLHAVERIRKLFAKILHYSEPTIAADYGIKSYFSSSLSLLKDDPPYIILLHSTTRIEKHWPELYWKQLISYIQTKDLIVKLPWATSLEYKRAMNLAYGFNYVEVLPKLSLNKLAQQIIGAKVVISIDTGLSHLAAALNKSNITLYGPTNPKLVGSYGKLQQAIISVDGNMATIKPTEVYQQLISKIDNT